MAFTTAQQTSIRHYLGYSQLWRYENPALEGALDTIGGDADASALALSLVASIDAVWTAVQTQGLALAGVVGLDKGDAELGGDDAQIEGQKKIGRLFVGRLSSLTGVDIGNDIFDGRGFAARTYAGRQHGKIAGLG